ncbi:MAG: UDP-N-acetylmuramate dehydrogenase, partial [Myxococcota bacterium]
NVLVSDAGFDGLVLQPSDSTIAAEEDGPYHVRLRLGAGVDWDAAVAWSIDRNLAGLECLSGIPGHVGAAPIQNIGAYGQEVGDVLVAVEALHRDTGSVQRFDRDACALGYRWSTFKGEQRGRWVVMGVELRLERGGAPTLRYRDLVQRFEGHEGAPSLAMVRNAVLAIRRSKSMVVDPEDPNTRSAGSFFVNPILTPSHWTRVEEQIKTVLGADAEPPHWTVQAPHGGGTGIKLPAAWLIERAGFGKGHAHGRAGLSSRHCLALINRTGDCSAKELLELARHIRNRVWEQFGVRLTPEPQMLGFSEATVARWNAVETE